MRQNQLLQCHLWDMCLPMVLKNWHRIPAVHHYHHQKEFPILKPETSSLFTNSRSTAALQQQNISFFHLHSHILSTGKPSVFHHQTLFAASYTTSLWTFFQLLPNFSALDTTPELCYSSCLQLLLCHRLCASSWSSHCCPYWHFSHIPLQLEDNVASCWLLKLITCPRIPFLQIPAYLALLYLCPLI